MAMRMISEIHDGLFVRQEIEEIPSQDTGRKSRRRKNVIAEKDTSDNISPEEQDSSEVVDDEVSDDMI